MSDTATTHDAPHSLVHPILAWGAVTVSKLLETFGIHAWSDVAAMLASVYSLFLIADWLYKRWKQYRMGELE
jgi:hypothetical protein